MAIAILVALDWQTAQAQTTTSATVANLQNFESKNRRLKKINISMNERTNERENGREQRIEQMDEWMDGRKDEFMGEWMEKWMKWGTHYMVLIE